MARVCDERTHPPLGILRRGSGSLPFPDGGLDLGEHSVEARAEPTDLRPAVDVAFEAFGAERLMFGSDWPVSILGGDYERWFAAVLELLADRTRLERDLVLGGTAQRVYRIRE